MVLYTFDKLVISIFMLLIFIVAHFMRKWYDKAIMYDKLKDRKYDSTYVPNYRELLDLADKHSTRITIRMFNNMLIYFYKMMLRFGKLQRSLIKKIIYAEKSNYKKINYNQ